MRVPAIWIGWHMSRSRPRGPKGGCLLHSAQVVPVPKLRIQIAGNFETWPLTPTPPPTRIRGTRSFPGAIAMAPLENWWHCQFRRAPMQADTCGHAVGQPRPPFDQMMNSHPTPLQTTPDSPAHLTPAHRLRWCIAMTFSCFICGWPRINWWFQRKTGWYAGTWEGDCKILTKTKLRWEVFPG